MCDTPEQGSIPTPLVVLEPEVAERHAGFLCDCGSSVETLEAKFPQLDFSPVMKKEKLSQGTAAGAAKALGYQTATGEEMIWWDAEEERLAVEVQIEKKRMKGGKGEGGGEAYISSVKKSLVEKLEERINGRFKGGLESLLSTLPDKR
jgi:hypothetical protein